MMETVMNTNTLPEPLFSLFRTEKVKVRATNGEVLLTPIIDSAGGCPLRGMFADGKLSVDKYLAGKQAEKELER